MKNIILALDLKTRTSNMNGLLQGTILEGRYLKLLQDKLSSQGIRSVDVTDRDEITKDISHRLCHALESGLESNPELADKVAKFLVKDFNIFYKS